MTLFFASLYSMSVKCCSEKGRFEQNPRETRKHATRYRGGFKLLSSGQKFKRSMYVDQYGGEVEKGIRCAAAPTTTTTTVKLVYDEFCYYARK